MPVSRRIIWPFSVLNVAKIDGERVLLNPPDMEDSKSNLPENLYGSRLLRLFFPVKGLSVRNIKVISAYIDIGIALITCFIDTTNCQS
jgi:hypothetical protein